MRFNQTWRLQMASLAFIGGTEPGVAPDIELAMQYMQQSAELKFAEAECSLGTFYKDGEQACLPAVPTVSAQANTG